MKPERLDFSRKWMVLRVAAPDLKKTSKLGLLTEIG
jgi:hypothetical protein